MPFQTPDLKTAKDAAEALTLPFLSRWPTELLTRSEAAELGKLLDCYVRALIATDLGSTIVETRKRECAMNIKQRLDRLEDARGLEDGPDRRFASRLR